MSGDSEKWVDARTGESLDRLLDARISFENLDFETLVTRIGFYQR